MASPNRKVGQKSSKTARKKRAETDNAAMPVTETPHNERVARQQLRIGEILKRERERRGYDIQQIADYLCIRRAMLVALENSRYDEFPADAYIIGFLRSYAEILGINSQEAINQYRHEMAGRRKKPDLVVPTPMGESRAPTAVIMGAAAFASLLIYIAWYALSTNDRTTISVPPPLPPATESMQQSTDPNTQQSPLETTLPSTASSGIAIAAPPPTQKDLPTANDQPASVAAVSMPPAQAKEIPPVPTTPMPQAATPTAITTPPNFVAAPMSLTKPDEATQQARIIIKAEQSSWILIGNEKGQPVYDHVMKPGEIYMVPNTPGLTLTTGNGAGITITVDGKNIPKLSTTTSHIIRNVPLEPSILKKLPQ
jgi:cytoskeletal protein RodZ